MFSSSLKTTIGVVAILFSSALPVYAEDTPEPDIQSEIARLEKRLNDQEKLVEEQQRQLESQADEIYRQQKMIESLTRQRAKKLPPKIEKPKPQSTVMGMRGRGDPPSQVYAPMPMRDRDEDVEEARPQVEAIANQGGILSPKGRLTFENTIEYTNTSRNLFAFNGVELAQVVLVGGITAEATTHHIVQETGRLRLGLTDRLEADVHVPFVYRNDAITESATTAGTISTTREGYNLGDIDAGLAYQINDGKEGWPFFIGNLRYKANNADGPFDVPYDTNNIAKRLPTGTGFQTVEASMTAIKVSDPVVLFGNLGYVYDIPRIIGKDFNGTHIGRVKPGDAINMLAGMAFAINQDISFSLGYKHSYVFPTTQRVNGVNRTGDTSQVGSLTMGISYALTPTTSLNANLEAGVTNDAPDIHLVFRVPFMIGDFF
ncbi:MAG: transporter [Alphaproteobacteria bacterium]|nr:transporter [Alphaproteobacteria bacterium]